MDVEELGKRRMKRKEDLIFWLAKAVRYLGACADCESGQDGHIEAIRRIIQFDGPLGDARQRLSRMVSVHVHCKSARGFTIWEMIRSEGYVNEVTPDLMLENLRASETIIGRAENRRHDNHHMTCTSQSSSETTDSSY
jgi:hypothetical protein